MKKPIIGIVGKAGSGKDTVANYLSNNYGFVHLSIAEPIKDFSQKLFGFSKKQLWGSSSHRDELVEVNWDVTWNNFDKYAYDWLQFFGADLYLKHLEEWLMDLSLKHPYALNVRIVAQTLGTEFGRDTVNLDIWINHLLSRAEYYMTDSEFKGIVTSDVRFENEMNKIHSNNGKIIRLLRNKDTHTGIIGHQSEVEQDSVNEDNFDFIINNNGPLEDLFNALDIYIKVLHA